MAVDLDDSTEFVEALIAKKADVNQRNKVAKQCLSVLKGVLLFLLPGGKVSFALGYQEAVAGHCDSPAGQWSECESS